MKIPAVQRYEFFSKLFHHSPKTDKNPQAEFSGRPERLVADDPVLDPISIVN